ncbi:MAG: hypothetical protein OXB95_10265 [Rhodobacteraceae bacterium]|nr:hypothetical protein [Paracoccaceae bacterium]
MRNVLLVMLVSWVVVLSPAWAQSLKEAGKSGDWTIFTSDGDPKLCGIVTVAEKMSHKRNGREVNVERETGQLFLTYKADMPGAVQLGYWAGFPLASNSDITASIDGQSYEMNASSETHPEWAWPNAEHDANVERSMKRGNLLVLRSTSRRGTVVEDTFSLRGVTNGLKAATSECS